MRWPNVLRTIWRSFKLIYKKIITKFMGYRNHPFWKENDSPVKIERYKMLMASPCNEWYRDEDTLLSFVRSIYMRKPGSIDEYAVTIFASLMHLIKLEQQKHICLTQNFQQSLGIQKLSEIFSGKNPYMVIIWECRDLSKGLPKWRRVFNNLACTAIFLQLGEDKSYYLNLFVCDYSDCKKSQLIQLMGMKNIILKEDLKQHEVTHSQGSELPVGQYNGWSVCARPLETTFFTDSLN